MLYTPKKLALVGGGQLGRMLIQSAADFDVQISALDPAADAPCSQITHEFTQDSLNDYDAVYNLGRSADAVTVEIENVCVEALEQLEKEGIKVFPKPAHLRIFRDKRIQKQFYVDNNIPTADFVLTENREDLENYPGFFPAVHKIGTGGYDGRGVKLLHSLEDREKGFDAPGVLEKMIPFEKEISVIAARNEPGETALFPAVEPVFHPEHNLVDYLAAPAQITEETRAEAEKIALQLIDSLQFVGLLAVEMFVMPDGSILVNESAPRPHNSGHHTIEANITSQFEQHLRAVLGFPLGSTAQRNPALMLNLLGEEGRTGPTAVEGLTEVMALEGVHVHLYGKADTKPFRKMGHVTITGPEPAELRRKAEIVKQKLRIVSA